MEVNYGQSFGLGSDGHVTKSGVIVPGKIRLATRHEVQCFAPDGTLKWEDVIYNLVVNAGLDDVLDKYFKASGYTAAFYVGLTAGSPSFAAGDTMASHAGWTEVVNYQQGGSPSARPSLTLGSVSGQSVDNSASPASFTFTADSLTLGGAFLTTDPTPGGSTGTLYGGAAFTGGNKSADSDDVLNVTSTLTASAS